MAQVQVYNQEGKKTSKLELADSVFGIEPNEYAMHLAVVSYLANQRQGTQSTLTRSEVSGGGAKPWRQKASVELVRVQQEVHSGHTAVSLLAQSQENIQLTSTRRLRDSL